MLIAWLILTLLSPPVRAEILTVPTVYAQEVDDKSRWIEKLADCESHASTTIKILDTNNRYSYGKYQWQMRSWLNHTNLGATKENILDEEMQDKITRHVLDVGGQDNWYNCSLRLGEYPL